ncbi:MAG: ribbon-helix-helix domain-containing protein [Spirochaetota bacterium]
MFRSKQEIITFKVENTLANKLKQIPNRSEFIRTAVLNALKNMCPLCSGTGILTLDQKEHWDSFSERHSIHRCDKCDSLYLACDKHEAPGNKAAAKIH